jgi:hypothetical protein
MSPSVRLVCYSDGDGTFGRHAAALTLRIDLPENYSAQEVVTEIERRLRETYPLAAIHVESSDGVSDGGAGSPTWHVYRHGLTPLA